MEKSDFFKKNQVSSWYYFYNFRFASKDNLDPRIKDQQWIAHENYRGNIFILGERRSFILTPAKRKFENDWALVALLTGGMSKPDIHFFYYNDWRCFIVDWDVKTLKANVDKRKTALDKILVPLGAKPQETGAEGRE